MADKCIVAMVKPDLTDKVVDAAKAAGATGATIIDASGTGAREANTFFGLSLDIRTEVILVLVNEDAVAGVLDAICEAGRFHEPGTGIAFVLAVEAARGFESQMMERPEA
jgi:nitrogen regulatory protein PII